MDYKNAGVDIEAGYRSVELMKEHVQRTMRPEVLTGLGGFSGALLSGGKVCRRLARQSFLSPFDNSLCFCFGLFYPADYSRGK